MQITLSGLMPGNRLVARWSSPMICVMWYYFLHPYLQEASLHALFVLEFHNEEFVVDKNASWGGHMPWIAH